MAMKVFSNNMDEPNLKDAIKHQDLNEMNEIISKLTRKIERVKALYANDIEDEDIFANENFEKFHMFYGFVLLQTTITILLGIYQVFVFRKKLLL